MATLTSRKVVHVDQENSNKGKSGAIVKKRAVIPLARPALGTVTNQRVSSKTGGLKQELGIVTNQRASSKTAGGLKQELRKPVTRQKTSANLKLIEIDSIKDEPAQSCKPAKKRLDVEPMEMGTPVQGEIHQNNVFNLLNNPEIEDIDQSDGDNPQLCSEFVNDIYQYMLCLEASYPIKKHYLKETVLKSRMRSILVDWLFQVHHRFGLLQETLYLTVALLDRFLEVHPVKRTKLQLAGVTAMLLASKYEEMYAPEVNDFVYITDQAFTRSQILQMEILILKTLDFNLGRPLPLHFLRRNSKAGQVDANHHTLAKYLMELSMVDYEMCHVPPSKLAAAALCLSTKLIDDNDWSQTLQHYSRYSYKQLHPVVCHLAKNLKAAETSTYLAAIRTKYASQKAFKISQIDEVKSPLVSELTEEASSIAL